MNNTMIERRKMYKKRCKKQFIYTFYYIFCQKSIYTVDSKLIDLFTNIKVGTKDAIERDILGM